MNSLTCLRSVARRFPSRILPLLACAFAGLGLHAQVPQITSVTPARGATGVALDASLVFTFDLKMDESVSLFPSVPPFLVGNIELSPADVAFPDGVWSADARTLTVDLGGSLPPSTTITWKLNPGGALLPLTSADGTLLATATGSFTTGTGGGGGGEEPPELISVNPRLGATDVPVTSSVTFVFDVAMNQTPDAAGAIRWFGQGLDPAKFTCAWSPDGRNLTCDYAGDLPPQTMIAWQLNGEDATTLLESEAGELLPEESGAFTTGTAGGGGGDCEPDGIPSEWGSYSVSKQAEFVQTSAADPVPVSEDPFIFGAFITSPQAGPTITSGSVTLPGGTQRQLAPVGLPGFLMSADQPATENALHTSYPSGSYTLRFTPSGQSERVANLTMPASIPPVPKVANYAAAQTINAAQDFTLQWNAFAGASGNDSISLVVVSTNNLLPAVVFQAPDLCVPRALPATATSIVIPANTLPSGKIFNATLTYNRTGYFSTNAVPGMVGMSGITYSTRFTLNTGAGGGTADPARFVAYRLLANGNPELTLTGTAARSYTLQRSPSLLPAA